MFGWFSIHPSCRSNTAHHYTPPPLLNSHCLCQLSFLYKTPRYDKTHHKHWMVDYPAHHYAVLLVFPALAHLFASEHSSQCLPQRKSGQKTLQLQRRKSLQDRQESLPRSGDSSCCWSFCRLMEQPE